MKPNLIVKRLAMTDHAFARAQQRFQHKNKTESLNYFKGLLASEGTKYIGETICEKGSLSHLYIQKHVAIYVSLDLNVIKTVIKFESIVCHHSVRDKFVDIHKKELSKYERKEKVIFKKLNEHKLSLDIEFAQLKYRIHRTRSANVKILCESRMKEIENQLKTYDEQLTEVRTEKVKIMRAIAFA